jgi:mono/diheme cytochrome c family protein
MSATRIFGRVCLLGGATILIAAASVAQQGSSPILPTTNSPTPTAVSAPAASTAAASSPSHGGASSSSAPSGKERAGAGAVNSAGAVRDNGALLVEGEKRFATNCGRCHQSPHHFPPRMMATVVRHMRVRATITDEDMRLILRYLTQ